jgi:3-methyladenine DNA glycosylase AlkC
MTVKSRFSLARIEKLLEKVTKSMNGLHLKNANQWSKTDPKTRSKVITQRMRATRELQKRRDSIKTRQNSR